ncbi:hypothetical protein VNI00_017565 [Paramarasmius palmivorus]|uniref:Uncharacterized protein n=1 Tax=Paramarasmius palmivorus TaxID=297713 RepID=A0AAW0B8L4_9AGAR
MSLPSHVIRQVPVVPIAVDSSFHFASHLRRLEERVPPITMKEDMGPEPLTDELWMELFGGDLSDLSTEEDEETVVKTSGAGSKTVSLITNPKPRRLRLDCVEIPRKRFHRRPPIQDKPRSISSDVCTTPLHVQSKKNSKRREKRKALKLSLGPRRRFSPSCGGLRRVLGQAHPIHVAFSAKDMAAAKGAHTGKRGQIREDRTPPNIPGLLASGFRHIQWDGRTPCPILDNTGRIIAVLCGRPSSPAYADALAQAFGQVMEEGRTAPLGVQTDQGTRRGRFPAFNIGCAMGMGSSQPVALNNGAMTPVLARLMRHEGVQRMAGFHNAAFATWAPRLYRKYEEVASTMYRHNPALPRNFADGVFTAATFNFGGNVWTYPHRDFFNWAFGWCFITALGNFDATRGGQIILWELKLIVDFPHAATIAIPSAVITHSNIPVQEGDECVSFTQYSAGPIFRWAENGCRTEKELEAQDPMAFAAMVANKPYAYLQRLPLYSTLTELTDLV